MGTGPEILAGLAGALRGAERPLIVAHDNPDPDALASAFALRHVLREALSLDARVGFAGMIGRAENRVMVRALGLHPEPLSTLDLDGFDAFALVDTQPGGGNNSLAVERSIRVVIDHHPLKFDPASVAFSDVRDHYGACATILFEYADALGVDLPIELTTALFYAIRSETQDLGRESAGADRDAYMSLLARSDMAAVARIQRARVPREYFVAYKKAIERARLFGSLALTDLGPVSTPDIVAEIADFLLRLRDATWSFCMGRHQNLLVLSLRTTEVDAHAGALIRRAVAGLGRAGGHGSMAGGQVPVNDENRDEVAATLQRRILELIVGDAEGEGEGEPLVRD